MKLPWIERLRAWRTAKLAEIDANPYGVPPRPRFSRLTLTVVIGAVWVIWLPWAFRVAAGYDDLASYTGPICMGCLLMVLVGLGWLPLDGVGWALWVAFGFAVVAMAVLGWEGGYRVGGPVLAVVVAAHGAVVAWAVPLLWRHGRADWHERRQAGPD
ncbi:hypothetical protein [Streptosporangium sp. NPDC003464]